MSCYLSTATGVCVVFGRASIHLMRRNSSPGSLARLSLSHLVVLVNVPAACQYNLNAE